MSAIIISAFPGCGKTYYYNHRKVYKRHCLDSDSSEYSWIISENNEKIRNPEFPNNYIEHIKSCIDMCDVIFVSSHKEVRDALTNAGLKYFIVYPTRSMKHKWLQRLRDRETGLNNASFVNMINEKWDSFINDCADDKFGINVILTESTPYLSHSVVEGMIELYDTVKDSEDLISLTVSENNNNKGEKSKMLKENIVNLKPISEFKFPENNDVTPSYLMLDLNGYMHVCYSMHESSDDSWHIFDCDTGECEYELSELRAFIEMEEITTKINGEEVNTN